MARAGKLDLDTELLEQQHRRDAERAIELALAHFVGSIPSLRQLGDLTVALEALQHRHFQQAFLLAISAMNSEQDVQQEGATIPTLGRLRVNFFDYGSARGRNPAILNQLIQK
jgi:hypothetical protein